MKQPAGHACRRRYAGHDPVGSHGLQCQGTIIWQKQLATTNTRLNRCKRLHDNRVPGGGVNYCPQPGRDRFSGVRVSRGARQPILGRGQTAAVGHENVVRPANHERSTNKPNHNHGKCPVEPGSNH